MAGNPEPDRLPSMNSPNCPAGQIQRYRELLQTRHYALRTVKTYEQWLRRFLRFHGMRHPREMGSAEVNAFLTHLAVEEQVSLHPEPGTGGIAVFLQGPAGKEPGTGGGGTGPNAPATTGDAQRDRGASRATTTRGRRCPGGGASVWQWAAIDGGPETVSQGSGLPAARTHGARRQGRQRPPAEGALPA